MELEGVSLVSRGIAMAVICSPLVTSYDYVTHIRGLCLLLRKKSVFISVYVCMYQFFNVLLKILREFTSGPGDHLYSFLLIVKRRTESQEVLQLITNTLRDTIFFFYLYLLTISNLWFIQPFRFG